MIYEILTDVIELTALIGSIIIRQYMKNKRMEFIRYICRLQDIKVEYCPAPVFGHQFVFLINGFILLHLYKTKKDKLSPNWHRKELKKNGLQVIQLNVSGKNVVDAFEKKFIQCLFIAKKYSS